MLFSCENSVFNSPQNFSFLTCGGVVYCLHIRSQYKSMLVHLFEILELLVYICIFSHFDYLYICIWLLS